MPNDEKAISPKSNVVAFVNPAEVVRRVEYAFGQIKALSELGLVQGPCASVITALAATFGGIHNGLPNEEILKVLDTLVKFLTGLAQEFSELSALQEQITDQNDQIASLMRQVQEFEDPQDQAEGFGPAMEKPFTDSSLIERAMTARCRWREEIRDQQEQLAAEAVTLDELIRPLDQKIQWAEGQELELIKKERQKHALELEKISTKISRLAMECERYTQQINRLEKYLTACKTVENELPEELLSMEKPDFFPKPPKQQPIQPLPDQTDSGNGGFIHITPLTEITGVVNPRRVQLERLAKSLKAPSETLLMISLYDLIPVGKNNLRMRGTKALLNRADKAGILKVFGFFTPDHVLSNWRSTPEAVEFLHLYLSKAVPLGDTYLHGRNEKCLRWRSLDLFTTKEAATFILLDEEDTAKYKKKGKQA
jgi:hypothetical protein